MTTPWIIVQFSVSIVSAYCVSRKKKKCSLPTLLAYNTSFSMRFGRTQRTQFSCTCRPNEACSTRRVATPHPATNSLTFDRQSLIIYRRIAGIYSKNCGINAGLIIFCLPFVKWWLAVVWKACWYMTCNCFPMSSMSCHFNHWVRMKRRIADATIIYVRVRRCERCSASRCTCTRGQCGFGCGANETACGAQAV